MRVDWRKFWVPAAVALVQTVRLARLMRMPQIQLIDHIPDDAFFYLQTARTFAATGRWSFDGVEPASGFHLLWGYLLAGLFRLRPAITLHGLVVIGGLLELVCVVAAAAVVNYTAVRLFGPRASLGVGIVVLSATSLSMGLCLMEAPLVMLVGAVTLALLCRERVTTPLGWLFGLGLLGMAVRSDYGLLPAGLVGMWAWRRRAELRGALAVLAGSVLGFGLLALHTHWISGSWVQSSVREKLWWSQVQGFSYIPARQIIERFFYVAANGYWSRQKVLVGATRLSELLVFVMFAGACALSWRLRGRVEARVVGGMLLVVALYVGFYRFNCADLQFWYVAPFQGPVALLCGAAVVWFWDRMRAVTVAAALGLCGAGIVMSFHPTYPFQRAFYQSGLYLHEHPEMGPAASWNCGMMGFFAGGHLTNLDGLVNDRIIGYAQGGTLARYVGDRGIRTIIDSSIMMGRTMRRRGGFADGKLQSCLVVQDYMSSNERDPNDELRLVVWRVTPGCAGLR